MKKLIAILVVFALAMGFVFAEATVSGTVNSTFTILQNDTGKWYADPTAPTLTTDGKIAEGEYHLATAGGSLDRTRLEISGGNDNFGGWVRFCDNWDTGYAWWKPMDMLLIRLGNNGYDGFSGKDGVTRWMFYQTATDVGVTYGGANAWAGSMYGFGVDFGAAFYDGYGGTNALMIELKPIDILGINIAVPFAGGDGRAEDLYEKIQLQLDLNLDFGNIAISFRGNKHKMEVDFDEGDFTSNAAKIFAYFGMPIGDAVSLDIGLGFPVPVTETFGEGPGAVDVTIQDPIAFGAGIKFASDAFSLKLRAMAAVGGKVTGKSSGTDSTFEQPMKVLVDVMPYFGISDNATLFVSLGLGMQGEVSAAKSLSGAKEDSKFGWHLNPYIIIGEEWGPKFLAGIKLMSNGDLDHSKIKDIKATDTDPKTGVAYVNWAIPIAIMVSF